MLKGITLLIFAIIILVSCAASRAEEERLKIGEPVPQFILKDADDKEYNFKLTLDKETVKAVILIMGDRKVRKEGNKWAIELHKIYGKNEEIVMLMVADLRDLPFFVTEGMVKWGTRREKLPIPILLDWEGKVNVAYKTQKGKPDLFITDSDGRLSHHYVGPYSDKITEKIKTEVQNILKAPPPDTKGSKSDNKERTEGQGEGE